MIDMFANYNKAKTMVKIEETKEILKKLYHIKKTVDEFQKKGYTHIILYCSSNTWDLAKKIFHNENFRSRGFRDNSNYYQTNYLGLLKLKLLISTCERKLRRLGGVYE